MKDLIIKIRDNIADLEQTPKLVSGSTRLRCQFSFVDEYWSSMHKIATFESPLAKISIDEEDWIDANTVYIPYECLEKPCGKLTVGVYGESEDGLTRTPTIICAVGRIVPGVDPSTSAPPLPPSPSIWRRIINELEKHKANLDVHVTHEEKEVWTSKQDKIDDLEEIRSGAEAGATALQPPALDPYRTSIEQDAIDLAITNDINSIKKLIPQEATAQNQLADKSYVDAKAGTSFRLIISDIEPQEGPVLWINTLGRDETEVILIFSGDLSLDVLAEYEGADYGVENANSPKPSPELGFYDIEIL